MGSAGGTAHSGPRKCKRSDLAPVTGSDDNRHTMASAGDGTECLRARFRYPALVAGAAGGVAYTALCRIRMARGSALDIIGQRINTMGWWIHH